MAANTNTLLNRPHTYEVQDSVTRPSDTTQYAVGDALSDNATTPTAAGYFALDFKTRLGGSVLFTDFTLHKSDADTTGADFDLLLFTAVPAFAGWEDNAAIAITDAEFQDCKGVVRFASSDWASVGTGNIQTVSKTIGIVFGSSSSTVYAIIALAGTYTPASAEVFTLTAHAIRD